MSKEKIVFVELHPSSRSRFIQLVVRNCPFCGKRHNHGMGEGWRTSHCVNKDSGIPAMRGSYYLKIDWSVPAHAKLKERYNDVMKEGY